jgi:hypothetical protein
VAEEHGDERAQWAARRREAAARQGAEFERRRAAEAREARELVAGFAREARERGLKATRLIARAYNGRTTYRTKLRGWYVRADRSLAVGTDGQFYILAVPAAVLARFTGVTVTPENPRLVVGEGARDGQSMPLRALLRQRLDAGDDWP